MNSYKKGSDVEVVIFSKKVIAVLTKGDYRNNIINN